MRTILAVVGTRPEAIKMAPVIGELRRRSESFRTLVCATGQHREMLTEVLELFKIDVDYQFRGLRAGQSLARLTARLCIGLDRVIEQAQPDWVLAQGDTSTAMVASLIAFYRRVRFGHVEAGLRTGDRLRPFPEEINRRIADLVADLYFAPTERARQTLLVEGVADSAIRLTGNTVVDALLEALARPFDWSASPLAAVPAQAELVMVTAHRRESLGPPLKELCLAIADLAQRYAARNVQFVFPVHPNPSVRETAAATLDGFSNVHLLPPLDYLASVHLMRRSLLILTDSGGIQEEAPSLAVPVLVTRETSERPEGIAAGVARLVGVERSRIVAAASELLDNQPARLAMTQAVNPYGDGQAARRVVDALAEAL